MMDAFSGVAEFVRMIEDRVHDRKFLYHLDLPAIVLWSLIKFTTCTANLIGGQNERFGL